jgi:hypothetical protein
MGLGERRSSGDPQPAQERVTERSMVDRQLFIVPDL